MKTQSLSLLQPHALQQFHTLTQSYTFPQHHTTFSLYTLIPFYNLTSFHKLTLPSLKFSCFLNAFVTPLTVSYLLYSHIRLTPTHSYSVTHTCGLTTLSPPPNIFPQSPTVTSAVLLNARAFPLTSWSATLYIALTCKRKSSDEGPRGMNMV